MTDAEKVDNEYRAALGTATPSARTQASNAGSAFSAALGALTSQAWVSTTADAFSQTCTDQQSAAATAGNDCVAEMTGRYGREPAKVEPSDYRATWY